MEKIWIIGAGHFGRRALRKLSENRKKRHFVLADPVKENVEQGNFLNCEFEQTDGIAFLNQHLFPGTEPDWIIPALPLHLAAEWCLLRLGKERACRLPLPPEIEAQIPNAMRGATGDIYASHATFRCPDDCAEPLDICTVTQMPRKRNMFELLEDVRLPGFHSLVIRSFQLGPGVGGYRPVQLFDLIKAAENAENKLLISTACRCHGVMTGVEIF
jgi:hypothetical protein